MDPHSMASTNVSFTCDGRTIYNNALDRPNVHTAHVLAGALFIAWALHWALGTFVTYLRSCKNHPYHAKAAYPLPIVSNRLVSERAEAALKVAVPGLVLLYEGLLHYRGPM